MVKVTYIGACLDGSGYAEAARNNIAALHHAGIDLNVAPISFEQKRPVIGGQMGLLLQSLQKGRQGDKIFILHATPPNYPRLIQSGRYNIGYAAWETDQLPRDWVSKINALDEVWVPSTYNVKVFRTSGVAVPIRCFPHTFNFQEQEDYSDPVIEEAKEGEFTFYSIFQWLDRKNPSGLLRAYLTEFKKHENVRMVIKTYALKPGDPQDVEAVRRQVKIIKETLHLPGYPKLLLISSLLSRAQIRKLHQQGDCYVSLHKCEGFGIPLVEAMTEANPVIATDYSGTVGFMKPEHSFPVGYRKTIVCGMPWPMYTGEMTWAEPDLLDARKWMRHVFESRVEAEAKGRMAKAFVEEQFSWKKVGEDMKNRLERIANV